MIVDADTHPLRWARPPGAAPSLVKHFTWAEHSPELLVAEMDQAGVDRAFLISYDAEDVAGSSEGPGFAGEDLGGGGKYTRAGLRAFPSRFWWFGAVKSPRRRDAAALAARDLADGAAGIALFAASVRCPLDDPGLLKVFDVVAQAGARALVSLQSLGPPTALALEACLPPLAAVLERYPDTPVALMPGASADPLTPRIRPVLELMARHPNLSLSTGAAGAPWDDGVEYPFANHLRRIEALVKGAGADRLMWGSGWPWCEDRMKYLQAVDSIRRHATFMTDRDKSLFLGDTAARFMGVG